MFERWFQKADVLLIVSVAGLLIMGFLALYSSSSSIHQQSADGLIYFRNQLIWFLIGLILLGLILFIPPRIFFEYSYGIYFITLILLIAVLFINSGANGPKRWINLGFIGFQPAELAKIAILFAIARYLSSEKVDLNNLKDFLMAILFFIPPFLLVLKQPDLGTALVFVVLVLPIFYWAGLKGGNVFLFIAPLIVLTASFNFYLFLITMLVIVGYLYFSKRSIITGASVFLINIFVGLITPVLWNNLREYQQQRIKIFLNPEADPLGAGYQIIQSKVAIGSGGLLGKGFLNGTQTQLRFLPEQHTDFIFAVIGEEFGFLGVFIGLLLFTIFLINAVKIANMQKSRFNSIVAIGIVTLIGFHMIVNIGMTIGLLPVTGLPLPFISYGGSAMLLNLSLVGLLLNFYRNRYNY